MSKVDISKSPYFDDFSADKNFYKILFRPGYPVQVREVNQIQSILQNQIAKMGNHIFENGAQVYPGDDSGITYNNNIYFLLVNVASNGTLINSSYIENNWLYKQITAYTDNTRNTSKIIAEIIGYQYEVINTQNYIRFFLHILSGNTSSNITFLPNETIYQISDTKNLSAKVASFTDRNIYGKCASANLSNGIYYINGYFVNVEAQTIYLSPLSNQKDWGVADLNCVIGLTYNESVVTAKEDPSLYDNAAGAPNYRAPGANRLAIATTLEHHEVDYNLTHQDFIPLMTIENGILTEATTATEYNVWEHTLARRTYDESGNYTVKPFICNTIELFGDDRSNVKTLYNNKLLSFNTIEKAKQVSLQLFSTALSKIIEHPDYAQQGVGFLFDNVNNIYMPGVDYSTDSQASLTALADKYIGLVIDPGKAYVRGYEIETLAPTKINLYKALDTKLDNNKYVSTKLGTFLYTTNLKNAVAPFTEVDLYSCKIPGNNNIPTESQKEFNKIGTARVLYPQYLSGKTNNTGIYKLYITDINLKDGYAIGNIHSLCSLGGFYADCIPYAFNQLDGNCTVFWNIYDVTNPIIDAIYINDDGTHTALASAIPTSGLYEITPDAALKQSIITGNTVIKENNYIKLKYNDGVSIAESSPLCVLYIEESNNPASLPNITRTYSDSNGNTVEVIINRSMLSRGSMIVYPESSAFNIYNQNGLLDTQSNVNIFLEELNTHYTDNDADAAVYRLGEPRVKTLRTDTNLSLSNDTNNIDISYTYKTFINTTLSSNSLVIQGGGNDSFEPYSPTNYTVIVNGDYYLVASGNTIPTESNTANITIDNNLNIKFPAGTYNNTPCYIIATRRRRSTSDGAASKERTKTYKKLVQDISLGVYAGGYAEIFGGANTPIPNVIELAKSDIVRINRILYSKTGFTNTKEVDGVIKVPYNIDNMGYEDVITLYNFDNGQRDYYYKKGAISSNIKLTGYLYVEYEYFEHDNIGNNASSYGYYSINSYPVTENLDDNVIGNRCSYSDLGTYTSTTGEVFELTDCIDFRPDLSNSANIIFPSEFFMADYHYYLPRRDVLYLDSNDKAFHIKRGVSSNNPQYPAIPASAMAIYNIDLVGRTINRGDVTLNYIDNKRYTMRDIGSLEKRIENLEYYTSLSLLELDTNALTVTDDSGLDKFKNGFLVDPFTSFAAAAVSSNDFSCAIDTEKGLARPPVLYKNVNLVESALLLNQSSNIGNLDAYRQNKFYQKTGDLYTLPYNSVEFLSQPNASLVINVNPYNVILYAGQLTLYPSVDNRVEQPTDIHLNTINLDHSDELEAMLAGADYRFQTSKVLGTKTEAKVSASSSISSNTSSTTEEIYIDDTIDIGKGTLAELQSAGHSVIDKWIKEVNSTGLKAGQLAKKKAELSKYFNYTTNKDGTLTITKVKVPETAGGYTLNNSGKWVSPTSTNKGSIIINLNNTGKNGKVTVSYPVAVKTKVKVSNETHNVNTLVTGTSTTATTTYTQKDSYTTDITQTTTIQDTNYILTNKVARGDQYTDSISYVSDIVTGQYISPRDISFVACGLMPNTKFYAFFDGVDVTNYCVMGTLTTVDNEKVVVKNDDANYGVLTSDKRGNIYGIFSIPYSNGTDVTPELKFKTGARIFNLTTNENNDPENVLSSAEATYTCSTVEIAKEQTDIISRAYGVTSAISAESSAIRSVTSSASSTATSTSSWTVTDTDTNTTTKTTDYGSKTTTKVCPSDPLCEAFITPKNNINGVFITSIDVFFSRKPNSPNIVDEMLFGEEVSELHGKNGEQVESSVILEIRPTTDSGQPSIYTLPFGVVTKNTNEIITNYIDVKNKRLYVKGNYYKNNNNQIVADNIGITSGPWNINNISHVKPNGTDSGKDIGLNIIPDYSYYEQTKALIDSGVYSGTIDAESNYYIDYSNLITENPSLYPADLMIPTRFTFDSPVYLAPDTTYCFSVRSNSNNYEVWLATPAVADYSALASTNINTNNVFSNLYNKKIFAEQYGEITSDGKVDISTVKNASKEIVNIGTDVPITIPVGESTSILYTSSNNRMGWTAQGSNTLMFRIWKAKFDTTQIGTIEYVNETLPKTLLEKQVFTAIKNSSLVRVYCANHGLNIGSEIKFYKINSDDISYPVYMNSEAEEVPVYDYINSSEILENILFNKPITVVQVEHDSFMFNLADIVSDEYSNDVIAHVSTPFINTNIYVTTNKLFSELSVNATTSTLTGTDIIWDCLTTTAKSINGSNDIDPYQKYPAGDNTFTTLIPRENKIFNLPMAVYNSVEQNKIGVPFIADLADANAEIKFKTLIVRAQLTSSDENISPVIDKALLTCNLIENAINDPVGNGIYDDANVVIKNNQLINTSADKLYAVTTNPLDNDSNKFSPQNDDENDRITFAIVNNANEIVESSNLFESSGIDDFIFCLLNNNHNSCNLSNFTETEGTILLPVRYVNLNNGKIAALDDDNQSEVLSISGLANYVAAGESTAADVTAADLNDIIWKIPETATTYALTDLDDNIITTVQLQNTDFGEITGLTNGILPTNVDVDTNNLVTGTAYGLTLQDSIFYYVEQRQNNCYAFRLSDSANIYSLDNNTYQRNSDSISNISYNTAFKLHKLSTDITKIKYNNSFVITIDSNNDNLLYNSALQFDIGKYLSLVSIQTVDNAEIETAKKAGDANQDGTFFNKEILDIVNDGTKLIITIDNSDNQFNSNELDDIKTNFENLDGGLKLYQLDRFTDEISPENGSCLAKYICKEMTLVNSSNQLDISFDGYRDSTCNFELYYRTLPAGSLLTLNTLPWIKASFNSYPVSNGDVDSVSEYSAKITNIPDFITSQVKIVMRGGNCARPPYIKNFKMIASV